MPPPLVDAALEAVLVSLREGPLKGGALDAAAKKRLNKTSPGCYIYNTHLTYAKTRLSKLGYVRKFRHGTFVFYYLTEQIPDHLRDGILHDPVERMIFCDWLADNKPELEPAWRKTVGARGPRRK